MWEGPAPQPVVIGRQVLGRDRETLAGHDEHQEPAVVQVAGRVGQEGVLRPLAFRVMVVWRVEQADAERLVAYGSLEQVCGQGAVQPGCGPLSPVGMQLHPVGLYGHGVVLGKPFSQLGHRLPGSAAGVEDADHLPVAVVVARRRPYQRGGDCGPGEGQ